jgi:hypothetical protein
MSFTPVRRLSFVGDNYESDHPYAPAAPYATYPLSMGLGQLPPPAPLAPTGFSLANINIRQVLTALAVVVVVALIMRQMLKLAKNTTKVERNAVVSRLSTKELATRLYDRLEAKGSKTNAATMRSLERLGR